MLSAVYGKKFSDAQNAIVEASRVLQTVLGIDEALIEAVNTIPGNNDRIRALHRLEAVANLMQAAAEGSTYLADSVAEQIVANQNPAVGEVITLGDGSEEMDMFVSLRSILMVDGLTVTSRKAITAVFGDPFSDDFMDEKEPEPIEEPEG